MISEKPLSADLVADKIITLSRSRRRHRQTWLLLASVLAVTALLSAVIGFVAGLGVVRSEEGEGDGAAVIVDDVTAVVSYIAHACMLSELNSSSMQCM